MWSPRTIQLIQAACEEDLGSIGDITSALLETPEEPVLARVVPRSAGVICGLALAPAICSVFAERLESELQFVPASGTGGPFADGDLVQPDLPVATLCGARAAVLAVERTLLNFLGRMSGVASLTRSFVEVARRARPGVQILDTRKTLPGWRELDRYAVRCGGGTNHRTGLYDAVLIKDNHLAGAAPGRLAATVFELLNRRRGGSFAAVEVDNLDQLRAVLTVVGVDVVLLDNFTPGELAAAVSVRDAAGLRGRVLLEASGGVTLENVAAVAASGVDRISVGALTHSAPSLDIGLDL
jgi:nicotinate-nucleotide pyrophosphorylase (carboxylating)